MYDQILRKDQWMKIFRDGGMTEEKIKEVWSQMEYSFWVSFMTNVYKSIPIGTKDEFAKGLDLNKIEDTMSLLKKVEKWVVDNPGSVNVEKVSGESVKQVFDNVTMLLKKLNDDHKNG